MLNPFRRKPKTIWEIDPTLWAETLALMKVGINELIERRDNDEKAS